MIRRLAERIEDVTQQAQSGSDQNQRVKPDETDAEELKHRHPCPAIVVCIRDHKAGQPEEKVDRQIGVVHEVKRRFKAKWVVEQVKEHDQKGRGSSQAVQHFKVFFPTTRTVGSNGNIHRTALHNSGSAPFSMRVWRRRMFQRTARLAVRGVLSEELPAST